MFVDDATGRRMQLLFRADRVAASQLQPPRHELYWGYIPAIDMIHTPCACTRIRRAARALTEVYDDALLPLGLKVTQFSLLRTIARLGTPSLTQLAGETALDRSTLGRNVGVLQRKGLVRLSEGEDLREHTVSLSPQACRLLEQAAPLWQQVQRRVEHALGAQGVAVLFDALARLEELR
ncbi:MarR family winged helix-turn-helix transcriptional regulator [Cupriavidus alkaliphilus]|uniref:MarR family winged helix-turn-helix transcriptional regulator n=2 Tax=Cupriavidus alkaliphilus TaxID=942866 RepID=UPI00339D6A59